MYSCSSFGIKVGAGIGTAISGWMLAAAGYIENAAVQTSNTLQMLHILYLWIPFLMSLGIMILLTYLRVEKANAKEGSEHTALVLSF